MANLLEMAREAGDSTLAKWRKAREIEPDSVPGVYADAVDLAATAAAIVSRDQKQWEQTLLTAKQVLQVVAKELAELLETTQDKVPGDYAIAVLLTAIGEIVQRMRPGLVETKE